MKINLNRKNIGFIIVLLLQGVMEKCDAKNAQYSSELNYKTVVIGSQEWTSENLNVSHFSNGDPIYRAKSAEEWIQAHIEGRPAWCYFENDSTYGEKYGRLYNIHAVNDPRGLAPENWQVASSNDFSKLVKTLGEHSGMKLKSSDGWDQNGNGTNESGFTALPGGIRYSNGRFYGHGEYSVFGTSDGLSFILTALGSFRGSSKYREGLPIRLVRDIEIEQEETESHTETDTKSANNVKKTNDELVDIDGNIYRTVVISNQEWMVENLKTTKFNDDTLIPLVEDGAEWASFTLGFSWYKNEEQSYKTSYGALYNWYTVNTGKLCPEPEGGWRIPHQEDWIILTEYLGGINPVGGQVLMNGELKSTRTFPVGHPRWSTPNTDATNDSGFSAVPGGHRSYVGVYNYLEKFGFWWTSTQANRKNAWYWGMRYDNGHIFRTIGIKNNGFSVRCVRDVH